MKQDFAVIKFGSKQEIVSKGDKILVGKIDAKAKDKKTISEVLLTSKAGKVEVGTPFVKGAKVEIEIMEEIVKGEKTTKDVYKAKSRSRRKVGARQDLTKVKILSI